MPDDDANAAAVRDDGAALAAVAAELDSARSALAARDKRLRDYDTILAAMRLIAAVSTAVVEEGQPRRYVIDESALSAAEDQDAAQVAKLILEAGT